MSSLIRLSPLPFSSLPAHPDLDASIASTSGEDSTKTNGEGGRGREQDETTRTDKPLSSSRPSLHDFLQSALSEAETFVNDVLPKRFQKDKKLRDSKPSTAKVELLTGKDVKDGEFWVCRRSEHDDAATTGSASWAEFESGLRENHSENEMAYTPSVKSVVHLLHWDVLPEVAGRWRDVSMHATMITHTFNPGALIKPRTFITLVISARLPATAGGGGSGSNTSRHQQQQGFTTVQIPLLNPASGTNSSKSENTNTDPNMDTSTVSHTLVTQIRSSSPKDAIFAHYASIERVVSQQQTATQHHQPRQNNQTNDQGNTNNDQQQQGQQEQQTKTTSKIEWLMATTSSAGGSIPEWVQRSWTMGGVPKAVVKDVGLFMAWVDKNRKR